MIIPIMHDLAWLAYLLDAPQSTPGTDQHLAAMKSYGRTDLSSRVDLQNVLLKEFDLWVVEPVAGRVDYIYLDNLCDF